MMSHTTRPPLAVWHGRLRDLLAHLTAQLAVTDRPKIRMPRDAYLSLSRRPSGQRVVRIARDKRPEGPKATAAWELEIRTFRKQMGLQSWAFAAQAPIVGVAVAFVEPAQETLDLGPTP